jgi:hypothetical protein
MRPFHLIDFEELLRNPRKGDPLLPSPAPLDRYSGNPADACAFGYRRAARVLVEYTLPRGDEAFLFYPILFLYRHHVELMLKNLILAFDERCVRRVTGANQLTADDHKDLTKGKKAHSLQWLWTRVRTAMQALGSQFAPPEGIEGINFYIQQLNEIDPASVNFRYTTAIEATKAKLKEAQKHGGASDIQTFAEAMERLANYLEGIDGYVGAIIEAHSDMLANVYDSSY